jgi:hypothetical protein
VSFTVTDRAQLDHRLARTLATALLRELRDESARPPGSPVPSVPANPNPLMTEARSATGDA